MSAGGIQLQRSRRAANFYFVLALLVAHLPSSTIGDALAFGCGGYWDVKSAGRSWGITSPNYPSSYPNLALCIWMVHAPQGYVPSITINALSSESSGNYTCFDFLEVRAGNLSSAQLFYGCSLNSTVVINSTEQWMYIRFYSNFYNNGFSGFSAQFSVIPGANKSEWFDNFGSVTPFCPLFQFQCPNLQCIPQSYFCDGYNDCGYDGPPNDETMSCDYWQMSSWMMILIGVISGVALFGAIFGAMAYCAQDRLAMLSMFLKENEQFDEQAELFAKKMMQRSQLSLRASRISTKGLDGSQGSGDLRGGGGGGEKKRVRTDAWDANEPEPEPKRKETNPNKRIRFTLP